MFSIELDLSDYRDFEDDNEISLNIQKHVQWYINQVYADLAKQHGRSFSYQTPASSDRTVLRKRTGELLKELKDAKFADASDPTNIEAGFNIDDGTVLGVHEGSEDDSPTVIHAKGGKYLAIPLRAALNSNGSPKALSPHQYSFLSKFLIVERLEKRDPHAPKSGKKIIPITKQEVDFSGENASKLVNSLILGRRTGRLVVPYYILAKKVSIPKRLFINQAMSERVDDLYDRLNKMVEEI